jgi:endonuclease YncB( thermonuclease family)
MGMLLADTVVNDYGAPAKAKAEPMPHESTRTMGSPRGAQWAAIALLITVIQLSLGIYISHSHAHQDPCHRRHSCPPDPDPYICGDKGRCDQCPDNEFCLAGKPRTSARQPSPPAIPSPTQIQTATVARVIAGDTLSLSTGEAVRLIGVDTPETRHPKELMHPPGTEALAFAVQLVEGKKVRLEFDRQRKDRYKRLLAYVYVGDIMLNAELVRQGYAQVVTLPPNVKYQQLLLQLQREAREAKRGLWGER